MRDEAADTLLLAYASELSKANSLFLLRRLLEDLKAQGIDLTPVKVRTDLGAEFDGDTVHHRPDGFHCTVTGLGPPIVSTRQRGPSLRRKPARPTRTTRRARGGLAGPLRPE